MRSIIYLDFNGLFAKKNIWIQQSMENFRIFAHKLFSLIISIGILFHCYRKCPFNASILIGTSSLWRETFLSIIERGNFKLSVTRKFLRLLARKTRALEIALGTTFDILAALHSLFHPPRSDLSYFRLLSSWIFSRSLAFSQFRSLRGRLRNGRKNYDFYDAERARLLKPTWIELTTKRGFFNWMRRFGSNFSLISDCSLLLALQLNFILKSTRQITLNPLPWNKNSGSDVSMCENFARSFRAHDAHQSRLVFPSQLLQFIVWAELFFMFFNLLGNFFIPHQYFLLQKFPLLSSLLLNSFPCLWLFHRSHLHLNFHRIACII
jgi:hypothetical protein